MTNDFYVECDICDERFWFARSESPTKWVAETETLDGEVINCCRSCDSEMAVAQSL
jgi:phage terminase large subunit GpA-like protein